MCDWVKLMTLVDALNRFPDDPEMVLMYIFPKEYGLHNVFTSVLDRQVETGPVRDYTNRDEEIAALADKCKRKKEKIPRPKRLGEKILELVKKLQKRHWNCSYEALIKYCSPQSVRALILSKKSGHC